jgi:hypothetical protein
LPVSLRMFVNVSSRFFAGLDGLVVDAALVHQARGELVDLAGGDVRRAPASTSGRRRSARRPSAVGHLIERRLDRGREPADPEAPVSRPAPLVSPVKAFAARPVLPICLSNFCARRRRIA